MQQITCKDREEATEKYITLDGLQGNLTGYLQCKLKWLIIFLFSD